MLLQGLQTYFAPLASLFLFIGIAAKSSLLCKRIKHLFVGEALVILTMLCITWADGCLSQYVAPDQPWKWRTFTTFLNFALSPCAPILLILIYKNQHFGKNKYLFVLPEILNILLCLISIPSGIIFHISDLNSYTRGPLFVFPFIVSLFYGLSLIWLTSKQDHKPSRHIESILLIFCIFLVSLSVLAEIILDLRFLLWGTITGCVIAYYLLLTIQIITYDTLTGTLSRFSYAHVVEKRYSITPCTIAMIDLDGLKSINDRLGHEMGNKAIQCVAFSIMQVKSKHMQLFRYGGDEFVMLWKNGTPSQLEKTLLEAKEICLSNPQMPITFSYGIAHCPAHGDLHITIDEADNNMYHNKPPKEI